MSSSGFDACREFEPRPSPRLARAVALLHGAAAVAVAVATPGRAWGLWLLVALGFSAWRALRRHAWRDAPGSVVRLGRRDDGRWLARRRDGSVVVGRLHPDSFVHPRLVVVGIADGWRREFVPLAADALDPDAHRRLRVWVRWQPP